MMSPSQTDGSSVLPQAEAACLQYNVWFSPYSADDSSCPTLIINMRMGRTPLVMTTQLMAAAVLTAPINPVSFWHQLAGSFQSSLILDCTPPFYRSATINAPVWLKTCTATSCMIHRETTRWAFSGRFRGQREFKTSYQHKSSWCPSEAAHSAKGMNYRLNRIASAF